VKDLATDLDRRRAEHLYRRRRIVETPQGPVLRIEGRELVAFCSNDYLGLANDPRVVEALQRGAARWGAGSGAAHLVTGHSAAHHALEEELAAFTQRPRALLFSTGYMANLGVLSALLGRGDTVFEDRLNHASLLDGAVLSRARLRRYPHADAPALAEQIADAKDERLVATDGVFSMDGDVAPLPALATACRRHGAWLMVDDAHGLGVLGEGGRGTLSHYGLNLADVPVLMGTLGKALGTFGAFVAGSEELIETLIQAARPYVYTTAAPPAVAEATRVALRIAQAEEWRRGHLRCLIERFRAGAAAIGLPLTASPTPIQPILLGDAARALGWSAALEAQGLLVTAIRPPTVPPGGARLRVTLSAAHSEAQVDRLLDALATLGRAEAA
jgi:8-amino-7-oxononanoate synthase